MTTFSWKMNRIQVSRVVLLCVLLWNIPYADGAKAESFDYIIKLSYMQCAAREKWGMMCCHYQSFESDI